MFTEVSVEKCSNVADVYCQQILLKTESVLFCIWLFQGYQSAALASFFIVKKSIIKSQSAGKALTCGK